LDDIERAKRSKRLPVVFTREEAKKILLRLEGTKWLMASLLYGAGLRLMESVRLRVKDVDFSCNHITDSRDIIHNY
jgi:integrase